MQEREAICARNPNSVNKRWDRLNDGRGRPFRISLGPRAKRDQNALQIDDDRSRGAERCRPGTQLLHAVQNRLDCRYGSIKGCAIVRVAVRGAQGFRDRVQGIAQNRPQLGRQLKGNRFTPDHARKNLCQVAHVKGDVLQSREVLIVNNKISAVEPSAGVTLTTLVGVLHSRPDVSGRVGECDAPGRSEFTL